jgi:NADPH-dependent ferric siderophore reductase
MPRDARGVALLKVTAEEDQQALDARPGVEVRWMVHPEPHEPSPAQEAAAWALPWPEGRVQTCIAGETGVIRALRNLVRAECGWGRGDAYVSGYWTIGLTEDGHQATKCDEDAADERALAGASA